MLASLVKYLIDVDTTPKLRDGLRRRQPSIDVRVVGDGGAPAHGTKDPEILDFLQREGYILVTFNRKTIPKHLQEHLQKGRHVSGIFLLRKGASYRRILEDLELVWYIGELDEYRDKITYIPL